MKFDGYLFVPFQGQLRFTISMFTDSEEITLSPASMEQNSLFPNTSAPTCYFYNEEEENGIRVKFLREQLPEIYKEMALRHWPRYYTKYFDVTGTVLGKTETSQGYVLLKLDPRPVNKDQQG